MRPPAEGLVLLTSEQLRSLVREVVREELDARVDRHSSWSDSEWLTADAVAVLLGYKRTYVGELVRRHGLPCHKCGRLMRFRRDEVLEWAEKRGRRR